MGNSSGVMVLGAAIKAFKTGISDALKPLITKYGFDGEISLAGWYPRRDFLAMLEEAATSNPRFDVISAGLHMVETVPLPPGIHNAESALRNINTAYQMGHQNLPEGDGWEYQQLSENSYLVIDHTPYPSNFNYGVIFGLVERFTPEDAHVSVNTEEKEDYRIFQITIR